MEHIHSTVLKAAVLLALGSTGIFLTSCAENTSSISHQSVIESSGVTAATEVTTEAPVGINTVPFDKNGMHFSAVSGFYDSEFYLDISTDSDSTVYYTLDGSIPTENSQKYTQPILIKDRSVEPDVLSAHTDIAQPADMVSYDLPNKPVDKATVVRAFAVDKNGSRSDTVTCTYFVGFGSKADYYDNVKVISLVTNDDNLFDYERGIYVLGKTYDDWLSGEGYDPGTPEWSMPANYTQKGKEWERPASIQFFENGSLEHSQDVGIRIHGGATRSYTQKSFNIYARKEYGDSCLRYDIFSGNVVSQADGSIVKQYDSIMLRNAGNDAMYTRFRDKLIQSLVADRQFLTQAMEPCILFINGEYWGQYEITEKLDKSFIKAHFGVPKKDVCIVKKDELDEGSEETFAQWQELREWINKTDLSDSKAYDELCAKVDMPGFMEYVSTEIYIDNYDWGAPNSAMWKTQTVDADNPYSDGKWRFILFDTEYSSGMYGRALAANDSFARLMENDCFITDLLKASLKNESFRKDLIKTFTDIADNNFNAERVEKAVASLSEEYSDMVTDTYSRFWRSSAGGYYAEQNYEEAVGELRQFFSQRRKYIMEYANQHIEKYHILQTSLCRINGEMEETL